MNSFIPFHFVLFHFVLFHSIVFHCVSFHGCVSNLYSNLTRNWAGRKKVFEPLGTSPDSDRFWVKLTWQGKCVLWHGDAPFPCDVNLKSLSMVLADGTSHSDIVNLPNSASHVHVERQGFSLILCYRSPIKLGCVCVSPPPCCRHRTVGCWNPL